MALHGKLKQETRTKLYFDFLQPNHVGLVFLYQRAELMKASTDTIDIKRNDFHSFANCCESI